MKAQGAIESSLLRSSTAGTLVGQGATEYLVLLAVVLIVALVSVALLGFFPGMAQDAQITQSQMYWQSATPIAVTETVAGLKASNGFTYAWIRMRNNGAYPIRITALVGADSLRNTQFYYGGWVNISDYYYLGPGEEGYFTGNSGRQLQIQATATDSTRVGGASSVCQNSSASPGVVTLNSFGFEYIGYIDGQQITKKQIGKDFVVKCLPPY